MPDLQTINQKIFSDSYSSLVEMSFSLYASKFKISHNADAYYTSGVFSCRLVVKTVLQKKQEFDGVALTVKPYEESMKMDNHDYEVFHNWCNVFHNFY